MQRPQPEPVTLDDILITDELSWRSRSVSEGESRSHSVSEGLSFRAGESPRPPNLLSENQALHTLARQLVNQPETILQSLVDIALDLCCAGTAGVSLLETTPNGEELFRWNVLAGALAQYVGGTTPRNFSPCGVCLERGTPVLFSHPERYFTYFQAAKTPIVEALVLPIIADNHALGSIWIMSHDDRRHFDSEDVRVMMSLADFTAAALLLNQRQTHQLLAKNAQVKPSPRPKGDEASGVHGSWFMDHSNELSTMNHEQDGESEADFRAIANLVPDMLWCNDSTGNTSWYNQRWLDYTGQTMEEAQGYGWLEVIHPDDRAQSLANFQQAVDEGHPLRQEHRIRGTDGNYRWFLIQAHPVLSSDGRIMQWFGAATDIHEQRVALEALQQSQECFHAIVTQTNVGIAQTAAGRFTYVNDRFCEIAGRNREDLIGIRVGDITHPDESDRDMQLLDRMYATGEPFVVDKRYVRPDGSSVWVLNSVSPLSDANGKIFGDFAASIDISDRKQAEEKLRESQAQLAADLAAMKHLYDLNQRLLNADSLNTILQGILAVAIKFTGMDRGNIQLLGADERSLQIAVHQGHGQTFVDYFMFVGCEATCEAALHAKERIVVEDVRQVPLLEGTTDLEILLSEDIHSLQSTPLIGRQGRVVGILSTHSAESRRPSETQLQQLDLLVWMAADFIERARAEAALRLSEEKYRTLFNSIDEGFCIEELVYDSDGNIEDIFFREVNQAYERQSGLTNVVGKSIKEVLPNLEQHWKDIFTQVAKTGEPVRVINYAKDVDRWFDAYLAMLAGSNKYVAVVFNDITDHKRREVNLAFLAQTSADFAPLLSAEEIMERVGKRLADFLNLSRCNFSVVDEEADRIECIYAWRRDDSMPNLFGAHRISAFLNEEGRRHYAAGKLSVINNTRTNEMLNPTFEMWDELGFGSIVDAPYLKDGRWKFLLTIARSEAGEWREDEVELIRELAERIYTRIERARAEAALCVSEEKYRTLFNSMDEAYAVVEVIPSEEGGWSDFRFLEVNPAFMQHTGMEYPVGRTATQILGTPNPQWAKMYGQVAQTGEAVRLKMTEATLNRIFDLNIFRLGSAGSRRVAVLFTDITARKRAEDERNLAQEAMRAFFSNVSHEFRTPLTLLLSSIQETLSDLAHPLTSNQRSQLELAHRNAMRLLKLVNSLLDVSRIEAGRIQAVYEPTDLATLTTELASSFESAIEQAGLQLVIDCPPLWSPVYVDRSMWEKIVLNLLSNAFKFTFAGQIRVSLQWVEAGERDIQNTPIPHSPLPLIPSRDPEFPIPPSVELTVQDTGIGISAAELPRLFERFYQVKGAKGRSFEGSGIGLSLVQELVKLHGGTIQVSSTQGEGSCFKVSIPTGFVHLPPGQIGSPQTLTSTATGVTAYVEEALGWLPEESGGNRGRRGAQGEEVHREKRRTGRRGREELMDVNSLASPASPAPLASPASPARLLLVDDNADMRGYLKRLLSERWQVETAANGAIALDLIQQKLPHLVLTDVMMPEVDGFQLLNALRADPQTKSIPIILLSARAGEEATVEGLEAGADDYLIKPFSARELMARVETQLQMSRLRHKLSANRLKDEFLATLTHELNAPLAAILTWARLLQTQPFDRPMMLRAMEAIERNANNQAKLVEDLLDMSSILAGKRGLNPQPVDLVAIIDDVLNSLYPTAQKKAIAIRYSIDDSGLNSDSLASSGVHSNFKTQNSKFTVSGEPKRLRQIITNLLSNAIKFTPLGGQIKVQISTDAGVTRLAPKSPNSGGLQSSSSPQDGGGHGVPSGDGGSRGAKFAQLTISDTGIGISADFLSYVFDRFTQAEVPSRHTPGGVGIGLAITRHLVELHGGTIEVASEGEGRGATFIVRLPLSELPDFSKKSGI